MKENMILHGFQFKEKQKPQPQILHRIDERIPTPEEFKKADKVKEELEQFDKVVFGFNDKECKAND